MDNSIEFKVQEDKLDEEVVSQAEKKISVAHVKDDTPEMHEHKVEADLITQ